MPQNEDLYKLCHHLKCLGGQFIGLAEIIKINPGNPKILNLTKAIINSAQKIYQTKSTQCLHKIIAEKITSIVNQNHPDSQLLRKVLFIAENFASPHIITLLQTLSELQKIEHQLNSENKNT